MNEQFDTAKQAPTAIALGVFVFCLAFLSPLVGLDGQSMIWVSESLITRHSVALPADSPYAPLIGTIGRGGQLYSNHYPLLSIVALPFVGTGLALGHFLHLPPHYVAGIFALVLSCVLTAGSVYLTALLALRLGASPRGAVLSSLAFAFGTIAWVYSRDFFAEPLLALLTAGTLYFGVGEGRKARISGAVCTGLAVLAKPTGIILGPLMGVYLLAKTRSFLTALIPLCATAGGLLLFFGYNYLRFEHVLKSGQPFAVSLRGAPEGALGLLLSPGRGLLWYCPVVFALIGLPRRILRRLDAFLIFSVAAGYLFIYSSWSMWWWWGWGPRFLLPALPGLMALTGLLEKGWRRLLIVLTLVGFIINSPNLVSFYERYYQELKDAGVTDEAQVWNPAYVPFIHIWSSSYREIQDALNTDVQTVVRQAGSSVSSNVESSRAFHIVAIWWWMLPAARIPRMFGAVVALTLVGLGMFMIGYAVYVTREEATD